MLCCVVLGIFGGDLWYVGCFGIVVWYKKAVGR